MKPILSIAVLPAIAACGTLSASHPLDAGDHRVGVTFGGPFTTSLGPPIPVPNLIVEGRSGLEPLADMPIDINYGVNVTSIAFGLMGVHGGASLHVLEGEGWRPNLAITERLHLYHNYFDTTKPSETRMFWGLNELDLTASWGLGSHYLYAGVSNVLDLADPEFLVSPFVGLDLQPENRRIGFQLETRISGINFSPEIWDVSWLSLGAEPGYGLISVTASLSWALGQLEEK